MGPEPGVWKLRPRVGVRVLTGPVACFRRVSETWMGPVDIRAVVPEVQRGAVAFMKEFDRALKQAQLDGEVALDMSRSEAIRRLMRATIDDPSLLAQGEKS